MKTQLNWQSAKRGAASLELFVTFVIAEPQPAAGATAKDDQGFLRKMEQWQEKMSDKFRDTWKSLRAGLWPCLGRGGFQPGGLGYRLGRRWRKRG